jgi:hypothetical protein
MNSNSNNSVDVSDSIKILFNIKYYIKSMYNEIYICEIRLVIKPENRDHRVTQHECIY